MFHNASKYDYQITSYFRTRGYFNESKSRKTENKYIYRCEYVFPIQYAVGMAGEGELSAALS